MNLSHIRIITEDKLMLAGHLYEPDIKSNKAIIWLHGNGGGNVFDSVEKFGTLAENFTDNNYSLFAFNNRGAMQVHTTRVEEFDEEGKPIKKYIKSGTGYEVIKECVLDIDAAIEKLKSLGYNDFALAGVSTGANKICVYNHFKPENEISKYILIAGGDDTGIYYQMMGGFKYKWYLNKARKKVEKGKGMELAPMSVMGKHYSWRGIFDILNPDGDYNCFPYNEIMFNLKLSTREHFDYFKRITKPSIVIYGEFDEYTPRSTTECVDILKEAVKGRSNFEFSIIPDGTHGFEGKENELANAIINWLTI
jgi:pimeloyl-ACP methyl ester carboxylesterase